jgi:hypothetical protein
MGRKNMMGTAARSKTPRAASANAGASVKAKKERSYICRAVFAVSLAFGYLLVPHAVIDQYFFLSVVFFLTFAYTLACVAYAAKENIKHAKGTGAISIAASAVGLAALSACGLSLACGTIGIGIFSLALPIAAVHFFAEYGVYVVAASILAQLLSLWRMGCLNVKAASKIAGS